MINLILKFHHMILKDMKYKIDMEEEERLLNI